MCPVMDFSGSPHLIEIVSAKLRTIELWILFLEKFQVSNPSLNYDTCTDSISIYAIRLNIRD